MIISIYIFYRYSLAQEHGDLINLHDWFQSFRTIVLQHKNKRKQKSKQSPLPKKRKDINGSADQNEASIQYPFYFPFHIVSTFFDSTRYITLNAFLDVPNLQF